MNPNTGTNLLGGALAQKDISKIIIDAKQLLSEFSKKFLPHIEDAAKNFSQFERNFEYTYGRANIKLTFFIALIITIFFNLGIDVLYKNALETNPEEAIKFAETTMEYYEQHKASQDSLIQNKLELANQIMTETLSRESSDQSIAELIDFSAIPNMLTWDFLLYLLNCIITSIFITFGAPFWNDIASALLKIQKGKSNSGSDSSPEESNG
ncbi:MAG: hypothetical protein IPJ23_19090 [Ignavibacteriales bacterium]|nr:hypothetical protein [Ignavibacteriales bacterium]